MVLYDQGYMYIYMYTKQHHSIFDTIFGCVSLSHTMSHIHMDSPYVIFHMIPPSIQVKGAGEWYVNGVYTRTPQRVRRDGGKTKSGV